MDTGISRVTRSKVHARANYNRLSRWYDAISGGTEKKYRHIGLLKLNTQEGERVLEIGYGTGHCLVALAKAVGSSGKVWGIDLSERMFTIAQKRVDEAGVSERPEIPIVLRQCRTFLRPGGRLCVVTMVKREKK